MTELIGPICQTIEQSTHNRIYWFPAYQSLVNELFRTRAYEEDFRNGILSAPEDGARMKLHDDLMAASIGELVIPEHLEVDQIEDWFVSQAFRKGLIFYDEVMELQERLAGT